MSVRICVALSLVVGWIGIVAGVEHPNVLLIVSDDQRADTIAALGNPVIQTPAIDQIVSRGTTFRHAICANPICTPSRAEILTGCHGLRNGVFDFGRVIDPGLPTLPEPFHRAGYQTWYSGKWHNDGRPSKHGYDRTKRLFTGGGGKWWKPQVDYRGHEVTGYRGWVFRDETDRPLPDLGVGLSPEISEAIADAAIEIINESESPFFLHLNFTAPHDPLLIPPGFEGKYRPDQIPLPANFAPEHPFDHGNRGGRDEVLLPIPRTEKEVRADIAAYYAVISHMDAQIGRIVNAIQRAGETDSTIIVFCSDHGLALGSHGLRGKQNMYEHTIRVPLVIAGPGIPAGKKVQGLAYLRDIFPTLCELAGIEIPSVDGKSQVPVIRGDRESLYDFTIGYFRDSQRMIRTQEWKWIEYPQVNRTQLFNLNNDPFEMTNLAEDSRYRAKADELSGQLQQWFKNHSKP